MGPSLPTPKTPFDVPEARRLYDQGTSIRKLAERFHVKQARLVAELCQAGAVIRRRGSQPGRSRLLSFEDIAEAPAASPPLADPHERRIALA